MLTAISGLLTGCSLSDNNYEWIVNRFKCACVRSYGWIVNGVKCLCADSDKRYPDYHTKRHSSRLVHHNCNQIHRRHGCQHRHNTSSSRHHHRSSLRQSRNCGIRYYHTTAVFRYSGIVRYNSGVRYTATSLRYSGIVRHNCGVRYRHIIAVFRYSGIVWYNCRVRYCHIIAVFRYCQV